MPDTIEPMPQSHIHTEADLDAALAALGKRRSAVRRADGHSRPAAAAPATRRICRPRRDHRRAAAFDRERQRHLGPARGGFRSVRSGGHSCARVRRGWRGLVCQRRKSARSRPLRAPSPAATSRSPRWASLPPKTRTRRSPRSTASGRGPPTFICCPASVTPTPGRPAIWRCRKPRGSPLRCRPDRAPRKCRPWPDPWRPWRAVAARGPVDVLPHGRSGGEIVVPRVRNL